jgi:hypothetical protein
MLYLQVASLSFHKHINYEISILEYVAYSCCKQNKDMNEMNDAHAYEMQCNYESQTSEVLQRRPWRLRWMGSAAAAACSSARSKTQAPD